MKVPGRIDRFMSECRAVTNLIGNSVATPAQLTANLNHEFGAGEIVTLLSELTTDKSV